MVWIKVAEFGRITGLKLLLDAIFIIEMSEVLGL